MSEAPSRRPLAVARAGVLAWAAVSVSGAAHVMGGGQVAGPAVTGVLGLVLTMCCVPVATRRYSMLQSVASSLVLQLVAHVAMTARAGASSVQPLEVVRGHVHVPRGADAPMLHMSPGAGHAMSQQGTLTMLGAHLVAVLVISCMLTTTERRAWLVVALRAASRRGAAQLAGLLLGLGHGRCAAPAGAPTSDLPRSPRPTRPRAPSTPTDWWAARRPARRGPPALLGV